MLKSFNPYPKMSNNILKTVPASTKRLQILSEMKSFIEKYNTLI